MNDQTSMLLLWIGDSPRRGIAIELLERAQLGVAEELLTGWTGGELDGAQVGAVLSRIEDGEAGVLLRLALEIAGVIGPQVSIESLVNLSRGNLSLALTAIAMAGNRPSSTWVRGGDGCPMRSSRARVPLLFWPSR